MNEVTSSAPTTPLLSVVIPILNEEQTILELYNQLTPVLEHICESESVDKNNYEVIFVNDGSTDRSWDEIKELNQKDRRITGICLSRNFGHHVAITAGLDYSKGKAVILMDGDLQDPPEEIPNLYSRFKEGYDLVYGIRQERHDPILKKITSVIFWYLLRKFSGVDMPQGQTMLRILSRKLVDVIKEMREYARFVHGMMAWPGFASSKVEVKHNPRREGKSKYTIPKLFKLAFHAVTAFSIVPLRLATYFGIFTALISLIAGLYFIYLKIFFGFPLLGYASIIVSVFFIGGLQLLMLGLFGEYLGRTYQEVQKRPLYILKEWIQ